MYLMQIKTSLAGEAIGLKPPLGSPEYFMALTDTGNPAVPSPFNG